MQNITNHKVEDKKYNIFFSILRIIYRFIKKLLIPKNQTIKLIKKRGLNFYVYLNETLGFRMLFPGTHEDAEINVIIQMMNIFIKDFKKKIFFCDIGSNFGLYSVIISKYYQKNVSVYSFEPNKKILKLLFKNKRINNCKNLNIFSTALSNTIGRVPLVEKGLDSTYSYINPNQKNKINKNNKVKIDKLDNFSKKNEINFNFIKIDVEGHEMNVLQGAKQILGKKLKPRVIMIELVESGLNKFRYSRRDIFQLMKKFNYVCFVNFKKNKITKYKNQKGVFNFFFIEEKFVLKIKNLII